MVWHIDELPTHAPYDFAARYAMTAIGANTEFAPGPLELNDISPDGELATIPTDLHPTTRKHLAAPRYLKNGEVALFPTHALHTEPQPNNEPRAFLTAWVIPPV